MTNDTNSSGESQLLKAALWYCRKGYSIIPVGAGEDRKRPLVAWEQYQHERPTEDQIRQWWSKWPDANVAIITGPISGIMVVDCDKPEAVAAINEFSPDSLVQPISETPRAGQHFYSKHRPGLITRAGVLDGIDVRTDGGYVLVPPSSNAKGEYRWLEGLGLHEVAPPEMPEMLFDTLVQAGGASAPSMERNIIDRIQYGGVCGAPEIEGDNEVTGSDKEGQHALSFTEGRRDESLFHVATCCLKGGMSRATIEYLLKYLASNCLPPFSEKETQAKVQSAIKRAEKRDSTLAQEVREWVEVTTGDFLRTECERSLCLVTKGDKNNLTKILGRLVAEGVIERTGTRNGQFRKLDTDCLPENWVDAPTEVVDIWLPFELGTMIEIPPGSIILISGSQDAGKSAALMNITKENMRKWKVHYFSSELNKTAFKMRVSKFPDITPDQWPINFYTRSENFADVIRTSPKDLNLIDYLEIHTEFYRVSEYLAQIHRKIGQAIAVIALQKDPNAQYGRGGSFTNEKPILSLLLDYNKATISKFKGVFKGENPRGMVYEYKLVDGCRFVKQRGWYKPVPIQKKETTKNEA